MKNVRELAINQPHVRDDRARAKREISPASDEALHRRDFFRRAAMAAGGTVFASLAVGGLSPSAEAQPVMSEPFPGYKLMLYVYGDYKCSELFLTDFEDLIPQVSVKIKAAVTENLITQENADSIDGLLATLKTSAPGMTAKDMYLLNDQALPNPRDFGGVQDLCQQIDQLGLLLPFAYQQPGPNGKILENARKAFHSWQDESMVSNKGVGKETLRSLYTTPFIKDINGKIFKGHARFRAITRAKMGGVFGPKPQMGSAAFAAFASTYSGSMKGNSSACSQSSSSCPSGASECCVQCQNDEYYCAPDGNGECVAMSDVYDTTCLRR
jgi:hypothetical protein